MLDISDGLSSDIGHICNASHVGVVIDAQRIPTSPALRHLAEQIGIPAWALALRGGEDYELCFTAPAAHAEDLAVAIQTATGTPVSIVGRILPPEEGRNLVRPDGHQIPLTAEGWRHF